MAINMNNHVFKGHKALLGGKFVTYGEVELPSRYEIFSKSKIGFDWGNGGSGAIQLAFSMLFQLSNEEIATRNATKYAMDVIRHLNSRDWLVTAQEVLAWLEDHQEVVKEKPVFKIEKKQYEYQTPYLEDITEITKKEEEAPTFYAEELPEIKIIKRVEETPTFYKEELPEIKLKKRVEEAPKFYAEELPEIKIIRKVEETPIFHAEELPEIKVIKRVEEASIPVIEKTPELKVVEETEIPKKKPEQLELLVMTHPERTTKKPKVNIVKSVCQELHITQKHLAEILEVPEGTVSSWAVKNEIPRLGRKAIEFYTLSTKNQKIVDSYKSFMQLLDVS